MKYILSVALVCFALFLIPAVQYGQAPNLGTSSGFAIFTAVGAFNNGGSSLVTGDIGTDVGALNGFPPGVVDGQIHVADAVSAQAALDVHAVYTQLSGMTCGAVLGVTLGNNQLLTPGVYCLGGASTLNGDLRLDAQGDPNAQFVFQIDGAFSTSTFSNIVLLNGASLCNVYWQVNGEFILGDHSIFKGTLVANGAITLLEGSALTGRALSGAGAVNLNNNVVKIGLLPLASNITANGPITFCVGDQVVLSGNVGGIWSNGTSTPSITVVASGDYFVSNSSDCGTIISNHIIVTVSPFPDCAVTGDDTICEGQSTMLCAPTGTNTYMWSTGAATSCIIANTAGDYLVTVTNCYGCSSTCSRTVAVVPASNCEITGICNICEGQSTELCAPAGAIAYLWSTGASTRCITVSDTGEYTVQVTNASGCTSICSTSVTVSPSPVCEITGILTICEGEFTQLCAPSGTNMYQWSTGATTHCISVGVAGNYSVVVTNTSGCSSSCSIAVSVNPLPECKITGSDTLCEGQSTQLCAPSGFTSYLWSTGETSACITVGLPGNYSVTETNSNGCSSICSKVIIVNPLPVCSITGNPKICEGQSTQLCAAPGATAYLWSTGATTSCIDVDKADHYSVTITNSSGCSRSCTIAVSVNPLPVCEISGVISICEGYTTQLCAATGAAAYIWSTGATTECINVNTAGNYSVTITNAGGCSSSCSKSLLINPLPACLITGLDSICEGQSTLLCAPAGTNTYLWSTGAMTSCILVSLTDTYSVTVTNINGCSSTCSKAIHVSPEPVCQIMGICFFCQGDTSQLCALAGAAAYLWNTGETSNCITISSGGVYTVTVTNASGCSSTCSKMATVYSLPICSISGSDTICQGDSTQLCAFAGATCYKWSTGGAAQCITVSTSGAYSVTVTNANGCTSSCSKTIVVVPLPFCSITGDDFICQEGQFTQLCAPPGAASYLWSTGETTNCISVSTAGTFSVTSANANGCTSSCSMTVMVNPLPSCMINGNSSICQGQTTELCVPAGAGAYLWSTGETTACITVSLAGTYYVTVTNANGCISTCNRLVNVFSLPNCTISGADSICEGSPHSFAPPTDIPPICGVRAQRRVASR